MKICGRDRERERDPPINYSLGISHVPFICLHLTNRHSGSQKSRKHGSHNPKKSSKTDEGGGEAKRGKRVRRESESRHCHKGENVCGKPTGCGWHEVHLSANFPFISSLIISVWDCGAKCVCERQCVCVSTWVCVGVCVCVCVCDRARCYWRAGSDVVEGLH